MYIRNAAKFEFSTAETKIPLYSNMRIGEGNSLTLPSTDCVYFLIFFRFTIGSFFSSNAHGIGPELTLYRTSSFRDRSPSDINQRDRNRVTACVRDREGGREGVLRNSCPSRQRDGLLHILCNMSYTISIGINIC